MMKKTRTCFLAIAIVLGGAILLNQTQGRAEPEPTTKPAPATSVAVCDVVDVFAYSLRAQEQNTELQQANGILAHNAALVAQERDYLKKLVEVQFRVMKLSVDLLARAADPDWTAVEDES